MRLSHDALVALTVTALLSFSTGTAQAAGRMQFPALGSSSSVHTVRVPIVLYHYVRPLPIGDRLGTELTVTPAEFVRQINYLLVQGYTPISSATFCDALITPSILPAKPIVLTFDDGTVDFATTAYPILRSFGVPATVFMIAGFIGNDGYLSWDQLQRLGRSPIMTIGAHGLNHVPLTGLHADVAQRQLTLSRNILALVTGQTVDMVAYPNGAVDSSVISMAATSGYRCAYAATKGSTHTPGQRYALRRIRAGASVQSLRIALTR